MFYFWRRFFGSHFYPSHKIYCGRRYNEPLKCRKYWMRIALIGTEFHKQGCQICYAYLTNWFKRRSIFDMIECVLVLQLKAVAFKMFASRFLFKIPALRIICNYFFYIFQIHLSRYISVAATKM